MTDLYKEAITEAKKIRELAEEDAKRQLLEKFTPFVKQMINKDLKGRSSILMEDLSEEADLQEKIFAIGEQDEDPNAPVDPNAMPIDPMAATGAPSTAPLAQDPSAAPTGAMPPMAPPVSDIPDPAASAAMSDPTMDGGAPIAPVGISDTDLGSTSLNDFGSDGKITVDVNDLFSDASEQAIDQAVPEPAIPGEGMDALPPVEAPPEDLAAPEDASLDAMPDEEDPNAPVDPNAIPPVTTEAIANGINEVAYKIDVLCLSESGIKDLTKNFYKQRLFSLLEQVDKLKENGLMSGRQAKILENKLEFLFIKLKEANLANSYKKIYREDTDDMTRSLKTIAAKLFLEENDPIERTQTAADSRIGSQGQHARKASGNTANAKANSENSIPTKEKEIQWAEQDPNGEGLLEADGFGDTSEEPEVEFEVSEADLMEAIRQLRKESIQKKIKAIKENFEIGSDESSEDDVDADFDVDDDAGADDEVDFDSDADAGGVDLEAAEADLQSAFDALGIGATVNLDAGAELGDDEEIEIIDDSGDDFGSDEEASFDDVTSGDDEEIDEMSLMESARRKRSSIQESKKIAAMKRELNENNLFTVKTVFLNKILMRESLSKNTTRRVVELLDKARTLNEAKEIYQKILGRLAEGKVSTSKKLNESASKATRQGRVLTENATQVLKPGDIAVSRWKELAQITKVVR